MAAKPVYALVGGDPFLQLQKLREVMSLLPGDVQRIDLDGERADLASVLDELRSFAMFGSGKAVVVRDADEFLSRYREQLEEYVASPSDSGTLILRFTSLPKNQRIYKAIAKTGKIEECDPPKGAPALQKWVTQHAKAAHRIAIDPDAAATLVDLIGDDLGRLDTELAKLAIGAEGGRIVASQVGGEVSFQREQEMWDMTNELAAGQPAEALRRWRQLLHTDPSVEFRAVTWLGMWLEDVGTVLKSKRGRGPGTGKLQWKYKDRMHQFLRTCDRLGEPGHARALDLLADLDHQSKSGVGEAATNVERFILDLSEVCV